MEASRNYPPLYHLDAFSRKAKESLFYAETLKEHLAAHEFISRPHKHDFFLVLYITSGSGTHTIDFKDYDVQPGRFFMMTPGQVHSWKLGEGTNGTIIFFEKEFYELGDKKNSVMDFPFFQGVHSNPIVDTGNDPSINFVLKELLEEFSKTTAVKAILRSYLNVLLHKLSAKYQVDGVVAPANQTDKIRKLEQLIERNFSSKKQPAEYADLMNISPAHLNKISKNTLGKTVSDLINDRVILESKRLFSYTDLTVSEVANKLNFSSPSYFIRFFKKHLGTTPERFKESLNRATQ